jgi:hypothetical protein
MSSNLDRVRSIDADWERGDFFRSVDWADPKIEFVIADWPDAGTWSGLTGMTEGTREFLRTWENFSLEPDEYRELDDGRYWLAYASMGAAKRAASSSSKRPRRDGERAYSSSAAVR